MVGLFSKRYDLLTRVPCEWNADRDVVTAKPRRNRCNYECGKDKNAPFKGSVHMLANDPAQAQPLERDSDCKGDVRVS